MLSIGDCAEFAGRGRGPDKRPRKRRVLRNLALAGGGLAIAGGLGYRGLKLRQAKKLLDPNAVYRPSAGVKEVKNFEREMQNLMKKDPSTLSRQQRKQVENYKKISSVFDNISSKLPTFSNSLVDESAEFAKRGRGPDRRPRRRRRRRRTEREANASRRDRAYSTNPYYGTKTDRNIRRAELSTRTIRNSASGARALSNVSSEVRNWVRLASSLSGGSSR